ncbi:hypothetical protein NL676_020627 [Syzygium grande]|nr:hypothetical protein NL676_020627 [Syzygium grande]
MVACGVTRLEKAWQYSRWTRSMPTTRMLTDRSDEELQFTASDSRIDAREAVASSERRHVVISWLEQGNSRSPPQLVMQQGRHWKVRCSPNEAQEPFLGVFSPMLNAKAFCLL